MTIERIEPEVSRLDRARLAGSELALAFAGLVIGVLVLVVVRSAGAGLSEFVAGPAITAIAAGFYAWASRRTMPVAIPSPRVRPTASACGSSRVTEVSRDPTGSAIHT